MTDQAHSIEDFSSAQVQAALTAHLSQAVVAAVATGGRAFENRGGGALLAELPHWQVGQSAGDFLLGIAERRPIGLLDINALAFAEAVFDGWQKVYCLQGEATQTLGVLRAVFAALLLAPSHTLSADFRLLAAAVDACSTHLMPWEPGLGRFGETALRELGALVNALQEDLVGGRSLAASAQRCCQFASQQRVLHEKRRQRLAEMTQGRLLAVAAQQQASREIRKVFGMRPLPALVVDTLQGPWLDALKYVLLSKGGKSPAWRQAEQLTETLAAMVFPAELAQPLDKEALKVFRERMLRFILPEHVPGSTPVELFSELLELHVVLRQGLEVAFDSVLRLPDQWELDEQPVRLSETLLRQAENVAVGQWFSFGAAAEQRVQLLICDADVGWRVFNNMAGQKVLELSREAFAYALSSGDMQVLPRQTMSFQMLVSKRLDNVLARHEREAQQSALARTQQEAAARERARQKALAEADSLRRAHEEALARHQEAKRQLEDEMQSLQQQRDLLLVEKNRLEMQQRVAAMPLGTELAHDASGAEDERLRLAVRLVSSGKLVFVDLLGVKRLEIRETELVDALCTGRARLLGRLRNEQDAVSRVINQHRSGVEGT